VQTGCSRQRESACGAGVSGVGEPVGRAAGFDDLSGERFPQSARCRANTAN
jgi:hypothetical protein